MTKATKETASQIVSSLKDLGTLEGLNYKERRELEEEGEKRELKKRHVKRGEKHEDGAEKINTNI